MSLSGRILSFQMSDNFVSPHISLEPLKLLSQCWSSEIVNLNMSVWGPFKRNIWDANSNSNSATVLAAFFSQKVWGFLFLALKPRDEGRGVGLGLLALQEGPLQLRYFSQFLFATWEPAFSVCGTSLLCHFPPTSLNVTSSLYLCCKTSV